MDCGGYGGVQGENAEVDDEPRSRKTILWWFNLQDFVGSDVLLKK